MIPQRWQRTEELFFAAEELLGAEREQFLDRECQGDAELRREVEALLRAAGRTLKSMEHSVQAVAGNILRDEQATAGERIGAYEVIREIGSGGMGVVFLARRADDEYRQLVAIKVLRFGMNQRELLLRFRAERQILANLVHPNIARLLDGGVTANGQPFLVMEYVDGLPILDYCTQHQFTLSQRLDIFRQVCAGVQCAHHNLVVHRDLKPANVLVDSSGTPKLLDFGIAKLLAPEQVDQTIALTTYTERLMTPEYASPEQVRGEAITTATDVYSLGVVLFELLTGARPLKFRTKTPTEIERVICESEPARPSTLAKLDADIETIILRAMDKAPARRYPSAADLAEDLRRYQQGYPILARRDSLTYRTRKFVLRNRWPVALAAVAATLIVGFGIGMGILAQRARVERDHAQQVSDYLIHMFDHANPDRTGGIVTARQMLDAGFAQLGKLDDRPEVKVNLLQTLALSYEGMGDRRQSERLLREAIAIERRTHGPATPQLAHLLKNISELQRQTQKLPEAERSIRECLAIRSKLEPPDAPLYLESLNTLALILQVTHRPLEAEKLFLHVLEHRVKLRERDHLETAVLSNLGGVYTDLGNYAAAEKYLRECVDLRRKTLGSTHPRLPRVLVRLGRVLQLQGKSSEAITVLRETIAIQEKLLGDADPELPTSLSRLGMALRDAGDLAGAEAVLQRAYNLQLKADGDRKGLQEFHLATLAETRGEWPQAEQRHRQILAKRLRTFGPAHESTAWSELAVGRTRLNQGDITGARALLEPAITRLRQMPAMNGLDLADFDLLEAQLLAATRQTSTAEARYADAIRRRQAVSEQHPYLAEPLLGLGRLLCATQRASEGESLIRRSIALLQHREPRRLAQAEAELGTCLAVGKQALSAQPPRLRAGDLPRSQP